MTKCKLLLLFMLIAHIVSAQTRQVSGVVTDAQNNGVPGATIRLKGKNVQTLSDADGKFTIALPAGQAVLEVTSIGFE